MKILWVEGWQWNVDGEMLDGVMSVVVVCYNSLLPCGFSTMPVLMLPSIDQRVHTSQPSTRARPHSNTPSSQGGIGDLYNFHLDPSLTLGCGTWGKTSVSANVGPQHLLNIKTITSRRENMLWFRVPPKVRGQTRCGMVVAACCW